MSFGSPEWLFALLIVPALVAVFFGNERRRRYLLEKIVAARLQPELAGNLSIAKRRARFCLLLAGIACVIVSLAEPRYGYTWEQSKRRGRDVIIAVDTSKSMLSSDVSPNRLTRAKMAAQDLIGMLQGDRVGLVAFAGTAFLQAPLTIDYGAVLTSVNELDTNIIPRGGTDIASAIQCAAQAFGKGESENRCLILITDGEDLGRNALEAARRQKDNFRIFTVGVGSAEGSIIPMPEEQGGTAFVKDPNGDFVKSRLDEACLRQIADATGGFYTHLDNSAVTMKQIVTEGLGKVQERDIDTRNSRRPIERYQWPLALGLALLAASLLVSERKRTAQTGKRLPISKVAAVMLLGLLLPHIGFSRNSGLDLYDKENYKDAYQLFTQQLGRKPGSEALQFDAGASAYKLGEFDKALDSFSKALTSHDPALRSNSEYNLANTLVRRGELQDGKEAKIKEWRNALQHYEEAMKTDAKNENAKYNRDLIEKLIKELEKEPPKQDQNKQDQNKQDQNKQDQNKQDQSRQPQNQQPQSGNEKKENQPPGSPSPTPAQPDKKLTGDIKEQSPQNENKKESDQQPAEEVQAQPGEMTEAQARALVDSLKGDEQRVDLNEHKRAIPVLKDW